MFAVRNYVNSNDLCKTAAMTNPSEFTACIAHVNSLGGRRFNEIYWLAMLRNVMCIRYVIFM